MKYYGGKKSGKELFQIPTYMGSFYYNFHVLWDRIIFAISSVGFT